MVLADWTLENVWQATAVNRAWGNGGFSWRFFSMIIDDCVFRPSLYGHLWFIPISVAAGPQRPFPTVLCLALPAVGAG